MATAYVYTPLGWVSGSGPKINGTDLSTMDNGIRQGAHITGLEADRTATLATNNPGALMFCTDSQIMYMSLGSSTWQFLWARPVPVSSLPAGPVDGQEIEYLADSTNGVRWRFRYNASSASTYKWEWVGGTPLFAEVLPEVLLSTTGSYQALTGSAGPTVTTPFAGDYDLEFGATITPTANSEATYMSYDVGASAAVDADAVQADSGGTGANNKYPGSRRVTRTGMAASTTLTSKYKVLLGTGYFKERFMRLQPIRVG